MCDTKRNNADKHILKHSKVGGSNSNVSIKEALRQMQESTKSKDTKEKE